MGATRQQELEQILGAIREVEVNLDRRDARAYGAVLAMWGIVGASVFAIYQWMALDPAHDPGAYAWLHQWFWVAPVGIALLVTLFVGARRWRIAAEGARDRRVWLLLAALAPPLAATVLFVHSSLPYGAALWIAFLGAFVLLPGRVEAPARARQIVAVTLVALAVAVLVAQPIWANGVAAAALAATLGGAGLATYARGQ